MSTKDAKNPARDARSDRWNRIGVLGGGSWGTTLAQLAAAAGHDVELWVRRSEQAEEINENHTNSRYLGDYRLDEHIVATTDLERVATRCGFILVVVPSAALRDTARALGDFVQGDQILVSAAKGVEEGTFHTMTQVLREETCCRKLGALGGPNLAREIMAGKPAGTVIASAYREVVERGARALNSQRFRVYGSRDVVGVELAGALKNILAIACGVATGMEMGDNARAFLVTRGLAEMVRLGVAAGAQEHTFSGLAGIGDIIATCFSPLSRNHRVGLGLAAGKKLDQILEELGQVAEGVRTTRIACAWARQLGVEMPIAEAMYQVLYEAASPTEMVLQLMSRRARYEADGRLIDAGP